MTEEELLELRKRRTFKKFSYRGKDLDSLCDMSMPELVELLPARIRRKFFRMGQISRDSPKVQVRNWRKFDLFCAKLRKAKAAAPAGEKPAPVRTYLRNAVILPEMVGCIIHVYNGKVFFVVEVKPEMIGRYLGEFSITYKPTLHGRPGLGIQNAGRFIPHH